MKFMNLRIARGDGTARRARLCVAVPLWLFCVPFVISSPAAAAGPPRGITKALVLAPGPGNPRNSEGDFAVLKDGRVLFVYTHFTGGTGDDARAMLASRVSADGGRTWSYKDEVV